MNLFKPMKMQYMLHEKNCLRLRRYNKAELTEYPKELVLPWEAFQRNFQTNIIIRHPHFTIWKCAQYTTLVIFSGCSQEKAYICVLHLHIFLSQMSLHNFHLHNGFLLPLLRLVRYGNLRTS